MPYEQVEKILDRARKFHQTMADFYQRLDETTDKEREVWKMILSYLKEHQRKLERGLSQFDRDAVKNVLDTWVQFPPTDHLERILAQLDPSIEIDVPELIALALQFDNELIEFYKKASECAPTNNIEEIFDSLYQEGKSERRKLVSAVFEL